VTGGAGASGFGGPGVGGPGVGGPGVGGPGVGRLPATMPDGPPLGRIADAAALVALLALAALLRLPGLAARGTFDSDQGVDALVVRSLVRDGVVPLLGPHTSVGEFHHGALYYYLLAPAGLPARGDDPVHLVALIALLGVAAVGVTWWLGRAIAGPVAGLVAGLVLALSATAVEGSTFIWNPNPIPFFAACSLAAAWRAASGGGARWWLAAAATQAVVQQLHVLGILGLVPLVGLWAWSAAESSRDRPALLRAGLVGAGIIALGYLPLLVHELGHDFAETRGAIEWLTGGSGDKGPGLAVRLLFVPLRVLSFPLSGPIAEAIGVAVVAVTAWLGLVAVGLLRARGTERGGLAWLAGSTVVAVAGLVVGVRSLGVVTPLPADHYHAFLWPAIAAAAGVAAAILWRGEARARRAGGLRAGGGELLRRGLVMVVLIAFGGWNLATQPPAVAADGGWPAAERAGGRVAAAVAGQAVAVVGVPSFKGTGALDYPLAVLGNPPVPIGAAPSRVAVLCDALFEEVVGAACGGPAEAARLAELGIVPGRLLDRFEAAPGRWISVYEVAGR
jgi:4-amino-4-deoxy-L-arabinose transferase-like glycosyltransferase